VSYIPQTTFAGGINPMESARSIKNLVHWLRVSGPQTVATIVREFNVSENVVRRHLQNHEEAGVVMRTEAPAIVRNGNLFWYSAVE